MRNQYRLLFITAFMALSLGTGCAPSSNPGLDASPQASPAMLSGTKILAQGNQRFIDGAAEHQNQDQARLKKVSAGQAPHTAILACSDSRVPPEVIFDQGLGDLFVVRTAGEVADSAAVASLEYAIAELHTKTLLVLGHSKCGAVRAAMETPPAKSLGTKDLDQLMASIRPNIKGYSNVNELPAAAKAQVNAVAAELVKRSPIISEAKSSGEVRILKGIYDLDTGAVETWQ